MIAVVVSVVLAAGGWVFPPGTVAWVLAEMPAVVLLAALAVDRNPTPRCTAPDLS